MVSKYLTTCFFWIVIEYRGVNLIPSTTYRGTMLLMCKKNMLMHQRAD